MLQSAKKTTDLALGAQDGRIGHVEEYYFDDTHWTIRYLVAQAGNWLTGRMVLISPHVLGIPDEREKILPVRMTRDQLRHSPSPESDRPVSRRFEEEYYRYFGWPTYWSGPYLWGPSPLPAMAPLPLEGALQIADRMRADVPKGDPHLRSTDEVTGYHIRAQDGEIGHVEDFLYDDKDWAIHYLVVDTRNWWPGKKVLVPPSCLGAIHWEDRTLDAEVLREDIRQAPAYEPGTPITLEFEKRLSHYYESGLHRV
jgi:hypothetical protein